MGLADAAALSSATLGLLTFLAVAQVRSRRLVAQMANARNIRPTDVLRPSFPDALFERRRGARTLLLIGTSLTRTVETGATQFRQMLADGAQIRVLVANPYDEVAVRTAALWSGESETPEQVRESILRSLNRLERIGSEAGRPPEIRLARALSHIGVNAIDVESDRGLIVVQSYEYRPSKEAAPVMAVAAGDGPWFQHFVAEANRIWADGEPWPLSAEHAVARAARPAFTETFGGDHLRLMSTASRLFITGVTRNTLLTSEYARFERLLANNCAMRFLLVDPESDAIAVAAERYYVHRSADGARERVRYALNLLRELRDATGGDVQVRLTRHPLAIGIMAIDPHDRAGTRTVFAEYYTYQAAGEPKFVLRSTDGPWCDHLIQEAEQLWAHAEPVDV